MTLPTRVCAARAETKTAKSSQDSLFEHVSEDPELWEALYAFAKAEVKPVAEKLFEGLLKIRLLGALEKR
ncbi:hypothetical protein [Thermofilum pendens]|uniref:Uncharacterized protein n=1 Tax=Thermofilum pendens (strain DSM 2475 / Hrk 5) TaxID=368408 RepID=A1RXV8_THEPD|nr:hypothetical protein [Thermofilum pendens]ABL78038.1 hypothetical protein Tpen_0635 [Thermofilum pendens Hrk 5]